eukprot:jgi/Undpi1/13339/HiC_scaffold_8.g02998.m1
MTARRPRPEESFEDFVKGVGRVSTQVLRRAFVSVYQASERKQIRKQLRGGDPQTAFSREELSVLRGVVEELGLLVGAEAARKFATAFDVKQVQSGGTSSAGSGKRGGKNGGKGGASKKPGAKGGKGGGAHGGGGAAGKKGGLTAGLLELRRAPGSPAVLVGRNNLQNERIAFPVAKAHELWLHARGVAGAHVLLELEPGQDAEDDDLAFAADVAVYFSKARQMINKMGGWGLGMVKFGGAKVVRGEPRRSENAIKVVKTPWNAWGGGGGGSETPRRGCRMTEL